MFLSISFIWYYLIDHVSSAGTHKVVGTVVVRTSNELTASQEGELEQNIINELIRLDK